MLPYEDLLGMLRKLDIEGFDTDKGIYEAVQNLSNSCDETLLSFRLFLETHTESGSLSFPVRSSRTVFHNHVQELPVNISEEEVIGNCGRVNGYQLKRIPLPNRMIEPLEDYDNNLKLQEYL